MTRRVLVILAVFVVCLAVQYWREATHRSDSVGWWYTLYSAGAYAVVILVVGFALRFTWRALRGQP